MLVLQKKILDILFIQDDKVNFNLEFLKYSEFLDYLEHGQKPDDDYFVMCYYLYKLNKNEEFHKLYSEIDIDKYIRSISNYKEYGEELVYSLEFYAKLLYLKDNNISKAILILQDCYKKGNQPDTFYLLGRFKAKRDKHKAIDFLEEELKLYYEIRFDSPMLPYLHEIERIRMYMAYLCYCVGETERALEHFHLAVDSKMNGSTFLGDWDYWLSNRDYEEREYEVMLKLKDMYNNQYQK